MIARKENPAKQSNVKNRVGESIQSDMRGAERCFAPAGQLVASECGNDPGTDQRDQGDHRREGKSPAHTSGPRVTRSATKLHKIRHTAPPTGDRRYKMSRSRRNSDLPAQQTRQAPQTRK